MRPNHSIDALRSFIRYEAETGRFFWLVASNGTPVGKEAALRPNSNGHKTVYVRGRLYTAGRLAWMLYYGKDPGTPLRFHDGDHSNVQITNLYKFRGHKGYDTTTAEGRRESGRRKKSKNPDLYRNIHMKWRYGISIADYNAKIAAQANKCAICEKEEMATMRGKVKALSVDHDHSTGAVRDLLCRNCNNVIGFSGESRDTLLAAIRYLDRHNGAQAIPALKVVKDTA